MFLCPTRSPCQRGGAGDPSPGGLCSEKICGTGWPAPRAKAGTAWPDRLSGRLPPRVPAASPLLSIIQLPPRCPPQCSPPITQLLLPTPPGETSKLTPVDLEAWGRRVGGCQEAGCPSCVLLQRLRPCHSFPTPSFVALESKASLRFHTGASCPPRGSAHVGHPKGRGAVGSDWRSRSWLNAKNITTMC